MKAMQVPMPSQHDATGTGDPDVRTGMSWPETVENFGREEEGCQTRVEEFLELEKCLKMWGSSIRLSKQKEPDRWLIPFRGKVPNGYYNPSENCKI